MPIIKSKKVINGFYHRICLQTQKIDVYYLKKLKYLYMISIYFLNLNMFWIFSIRLGSGDAIVWFL